MGTTTRLGLPYPDDSDLVADGAGVIEALAEGLDTAALITTGNYAARPGSAIVGDEYYATDIKRLLVWDGTAWMPSQNLGTAASDACAGNDARLSDARTPTSHAASHLANGADPVVPASVTSLPGSPFDGQEVYYQLPSSSVRWHLRYCSDMSGSSKWLPLGSPRISASVDASTVGTKNDPSWTDPADSLGPSITVPLAGIYEAEAAADGSCDSSGFYVRIAPKFGSTAINQGDRGIIQAASTVPVYPLRTKPGATGTMSASGVIKVQYGGGQEGSAVASFVYRRLVVRPLWVG